jgi:hypothetical protein
MGTLVASHHSPNGVGILRRGTANQILRARLLEAVSRRVDLEGTHGTIDEFQHG